ncbi:MAG TPA: hypothetical protein VF618_04495 [Thermoanaerobaculia bacterium]
MKPIHLNLAARPYRDNRPVYAVVVVTSLLIAFLALTNFDTWYRYRTETQATRAKIDRNEAAAAQERSRNQVVTSQIGRIDLTRLDRQTRFINAKLAERAFSWSELLDHLEGVVVDDVRLVSITPQVDDETGKVKLELQFESKSADGLVTTMERFGRDAQFRDPFPSTEILQNENSYMFTLNVEYRPSNAKVIR